MTSLIVLCDGGLAIDLLGILLFDDLAFFGRGCRWCMLERHVPALVGVSAASSAASASTSMASASTATSTATASSASIPVGRDEMGLPDLSGVENFAAPLVVAFGGWAIGRRVSFNSR